MPAAKRKIIHDELQAQAQAEQVVESRLQQLRDQRQAEQVVESRLRQLRQQYQMQPALSRRRLEPMRPPPRDAQIPLLPSEEEEYDDASYEGDFRSTGSGSGISAPSFIVEQRHNMPYEEQLSSMEKHQQGRRMAKKINKVALRRSNSFQGNDRASPTRALMPAHELSKKLIEEDPYQEKAQYRNERLRAMYEIAEGKTKRKKRSKPKTKRKKHTKKRKIKKRKSTIKK
tara:strand:+ start:1417 stop:2103 length:687 start_codon:yes stop_codon:yes gene_type:complete